MSLEDLTTSEPKERYYFKHHPEAVLTCLKVLAWYLGDGKERWCLARYSWTMAARILGLYGKDGKWRAPSYWRKRLKGFGLNPETFQIEDQKRFGVAWEMLNKYCEEGRPWDLTLSGYSVVMKEVEEGTRAWKPAGVVSIPFVGTRKQKKAKRNGAVVPAAKKAARNNWFKERLQAYKREFEDL